MKKPTFRNSVSTLAAFVLGAAVALNAVAQDDALVIKSGRFMDPETRFDCSPSAGFGLQPLLG